jgi:hypothetical protein
LPGSTSGAWPETEIHDGFVTGEKRGNRRQVQVEGRKAMPRVTSV